MAIFHMNIRPIKRSTGQQATGAAAYCAGETIRDERTGDVHNHSRRKDVRHGEIILPSRFGESPMVWARDRASLWNAAEAAEKRRDSRVAREYEVSLPRELSPEQRLALARSFSRELADRYGVAVDLAIHDPKPGRESSNFHAHLLTTTREVTPTGLGAKAPLELGAVARAKQGLTSHNEEYSELRERWAVLTNQALREANIEARVDHRSLAAQGIERKPLLHIPMEFYQLERRGVPKEVAERLREDYRARVAAYLERSAGSARAERAAAQPERAAPQAEQPAPQPDREVVTPRNAEEIRRRAVQAWLRMRSKGAESSAEQGTLAESTSTRDADKGRGR
jgi:ATP-dependent exoDNAse (exonuclease V) alpha subunit